jgi:hypothetical protein
LAVVEALAGVVAWCTEIIQEPGPSLFTVQAWWHEELWIDTPSSLLSQGHWTEIHSFNFLTRPSDVAGLGKGANDPRNFLISSFISSVTH